MRTKKLSRILVGTSLLLVFALALPLTGTCGQAGPPYDKELVITTDSLTGGNSLPNMGTGVDMSLWMSMYDYLVYRDVKTGQPSLPGVADSWDISDDFTTYTFHLHKGIQFHNGWGELTAEDVKYTYDLATSKGSINTRLDYLQKGVVSVVVKDPYTVVFHMAGADWKFMESASNFFPILPIVCKKYVEKVGIKEANENPIGSGPYKVIDRRAGDFIKFEAVPNHWRKTGDFKYITIKCVPEISTRIAMLKAGEADIVPLPFDKVPAMKKAGIRILFNPGSRLYWAVFPGVPTLPTHPQFRPEKPWWADPANTKEWERALKVRKAMSLAVDRQEINDSLFMGTGTLFPVGFIWPSQVAQGYDNSWKVPPYDPKEAKRLLAEAGYPDGFEITMILLKQSGRPEAPDLGEAVAMYWEQIGLKVKRIPMDFATVRPLLYGRKLEDMSWVYGMPFYTEPIMMIETSGTSAYGYVPTCEDARCDELAHKAFAETDPAKRADLVRQYLQIHYENYYEIPLVGKSSVWGMSAKVGEWPVIPGIGYDTQNLEFITIKK